MTFTLTGFSNTGLWDTGQCIYIDRTFKHGAVGYWPWHLHWQDFQTRGCGILAKAFTLTGLSNTGLWDTGQSIYIDRTFKHGAVGYRNSHVDWVCAVSVECPTCSWHYFIDWRISSVDYCSFTAHFLPPSACISDCCCQRGGRHHYVLLALVLRSARVLRSCWLQPLLLYGEPNLSNWAVFRPDQHLSLMLIWQASVTSDWYIIW